MHYIVETLDGRHTGHELWKYRLYVTQFLLNQFSNERFRYYHVLRTWMAEQYGPSCERDFYTTTAHALKGHEIFDPPWCWHVDREKSYLYIYVKSDEVLSNIQLKWS